MFKDLTISEQIDVIVNASFFVEHPIYKDDVILLKYPAGKDRMFSDFLYKRAINRAVMDNIVSREEMLDMLLNRGVITEKDIEREEFLETQIKANKILLTKMKFAKDKIKKLENKISKLENDLNTLRAFKESFLVNTSDSLAIGEKLNYLVWAALHHVDGTRLWDTYEDYMTESNIDIKNAVYSVALTFLYGFDMKQLRFIARNHEWRVRYTSFLKGTFPLFACSPSDYTKDQLGLMHWSNYYQSIYEMLPSDRPDEATINDDDALDKYMEEYFKEAEQEARISRTQNKGSDAFDREEVIVTRFSELYEELEYDKVKPKGDGTVVHEGRRKR